MIRRAPFVRVTIGLLLLAGWTSADPTPAALEQELFRLVNAYRTAQRLPALALDTRISREARRHSAEMADGDAPFGHDGFVERIAALRRLMPCPSAAENVATELGHDRPAEEIVRGWLASPGHRKNIVGSYAVTGVGVARSASGKLYVTQIFVGTVTPRDK